jgi:hypothetical protein
LFLHPHIGDAGEEMSIAALCIEVFIFAEMPDIPVLRLDALNRLVLCFHQARQWDKGWDKGPRLSSLTIRRVYEATKSNCPLRRVLVAGLCQYIDDTEVLQADMPGQFLVDMVHHLRRITTEMVDNYGYRCSMPSACGFHEHKTDLEIERCELNKDRELDFFE